MKDVTQASAHNVFGNNAMHNARLININIICTTILFGGMYINNNNMSENCAQFDCDNIIIPFSNNTREFEMVKWY